MRHFLSPAEQALLDALPLDERAVLRDLFDVLGARLVEEPSLSWMKESKRPAQAWWVEREVA